MLTTLTAGTLTTPVQLFQQWLDTQNANFLAAGAAPVHSAFVGTIGGGRSVQ